MPQLIICRFIQGLGLGAEIVVGYSTLTEFVPPATRGRWLAFMAFLTVCGFPVTAILSYLIIPSFGWRPMFVIAGVGALIVWYLRKSLPESPRWLESSGRTQEAEAILQSIEKEAASAGVRRSKAVSQAGTRTGAPPMMSTQAPGTKLADGHKAPQKGRPPRPAASARHLNGNVRTRMHHRFSSSLVLSRSACCVTR